MIPGDWQAIHIYYAGNRRPMLTDCIRPLVAGLREDGLLSGYFFINYWLEGPHVRLRLRPSRPDATGPLCQRAEAAIGGFLRSRPALYEVSTETFFEVYNRMFDLEFTDAERQQYLDADGRMRLEANNSYKYVPYEPEYGKYGGVAGVALAEWHFEHSSDLVIDATGTMNLHLRRVVLGLSAQLMMIMTTVFMRDKDATADFLQQYTNFWHGTFEGIFTMDTASSYDKAYETMNGALSRRFLELRAGCLAGDGHRLPGLLGRWYEHCVELRARLADLARTGQLILRDWDGRHAAVTDVTDALRLVLAPYLHMTNNRLGLTLADESYLGHVLAKALRDRAPAEVNR
jgi:thiopeptide-type bacteriocin biosynthesis protein